MACSPRPCELPKIRFWWKKERSTFCQWCDTPYVYDPYDGWVAWPSNKLLCLEAFGYPQPRPQQNLGVWP